MKQLDEAKTQKQFNGFVSMYAIINAFIIFVYNIYKSIISPIKESPILVINWRYSTINNKLPYEIKFPNVLVINPINIYNEWVQNKLPFNKGFEKGIRFYLWFYVMSGLCDVNRPLTPKIYTNHYTENPNIDVLYPYDELMDKDKAYKMGVNPLPVNEYKKFFKKYSEDGTNTYYNDIINHNIQDHLVNIMMLISNKDNIIIQKSNQPSTSISFKNIFYNDLIHSIKISFGYHRYIDIEMYNLKTNNKFADSSYINDCFFDTYFRFSFIDLFINHWIYARFMNDEMSELKIFVNLDFNYDVFKQNKIPSINKKHIIVLEPNFKF